MMVYGRKSPPSLLFTFASCQPDEDDDDDDDGDSVEKEKQIDDDALSPMRCAYLICYPLAEN
jgi:hypothetical protein